MLLFLSRKKEKLRTQCLRKRKSELLREYSDKMFYRVETEHFNVLHSLYNIWWEQRWLGEIDVYVHTLELLQNRVNQCYTY